MSSSNDDCACEESSSMSEMFEDFADFSDELTEPVRRRRTLCQRCIRPLRVCLCSHLPDLQHVDTKVLILQHPREEIRGNRTVPLLEACLEEGCVEVVRGKKFPAGRFESVDEALAHPDTIVLYPARQAVDIQRVAPPTTGQRTLVVLDGTWKQARGLYVQNERLRAIPAVCLSGQQTSAYVIRTQPTDAALSTLESVALALSILEDKPELFETLVQPLRVLCDIQLDHGAQVHQSKEAVMRKQLELEGPEYDGQEREEEVADPHLSRRQRRKLRNRLAAIKS